MATRHLVRQIFWIDGLGALAAGTCLLIFRSFFGGLYELPLTLLTVLGIANLAYGTFALTLASRNRRPVAWITGLALANYGWAVACAFLLIRFDGDATRFGLGHFLIEGAWVATLGTIEWRNRRELTGR